MSARRSLASAAVVLFLFACNRGDRTEPPPVEPPNPRVLFQPLPGSVEVDAAKVDLGNRLYHDPVLSGDGTLSCASCHDIANGGDDGRVSSIGIGGAVGPINSPTVLNSAHSFAQFWDGRAADLEAQAVGPVENPLEMGNTFEQAVASLEQRPGYVAAFAAIYPDGITRANIADAIAEFERTLDTRGRWDAFLEGDDAALSELERQGLERFMALGCTACHNGMLLGGTSYQKMGLVRDYFAQRGGELTDADQGRFNVTGLETDRHLFKVPTLRNVALTAPYFHDGTAATLAEAVGVMAQVQLGVDLEEEVSEDRKCDLKMLKMENGDL